MLASNDERYVILSPNQYGYRQNTSILETAVFKEVLHKYKNVNIIVYAYFLDLNRAFVVINHCTFIDKMKKKDTSDFIIQLFKHMFLFLSIEWPNS